MSTSILYPAFGIRGLKHCRTRFEQGEIIFEAAMTEALAICPVCGSRDVIYKGARVRALQMVPIGSKRVWLDLLARVGRTLLFHRTFLLNYFPHGISPA